jgi:hypothetical protein
LLHTRGRADHARERQRALDAVGGLAERAPQNVLHAFDVDGFGEIVRGARAQRIDGVVHDRLAGDDEQRGSRRGDMANQLDALAVRQANVGKDNVRVAASDLQPRLAQRVGGSRREPLRLCDFFE